MRRIGVCVLFAFWCAPGQPAIAQELTARQQLILKTAMATDGWLTEAMHREFWFVVPAATRSDPRSLAMFTSPISLPSSDTLRYQKETWEIIDSPAIVIQHLQHLEVTPDKISVEWFINGAPLARQPRVLVSISRLSGEATETFSMRPSPDKFWEWHWIRQGQCELHNRKP